MKRDFRAVTDKRAVLFPALIVCLAITLLFLVLGTWSFWRLFELRVNGSDSSYSLTFYGGRFYVLRLNDFKLMNSWSYGTLALTKDLSPGPADAPQISVMGVRWSYRVPTIPSIITLTFLGIPFPYLAVVFGVMTIMLRRRIRKIPHGHGFTVQPHGDVGA